MPTCRRLGPDDAEAYRALMLQAYAEHPDAYTSTVAEREPLPLAWWRERMPLADDAATLVVGALVDDVLVGAAGLAFERRVRTAHRATLFGMVVQPAFRRRGLGRALVEAVLAQARARPGLQRVQLTVTRGNAEAERLYAACGFSTWGVEPQAVRLGDGWLDKAHMSCAVRPPRGLARPAGADD